ncbi:MAG: ABC transporter permease [Tenuifilaceae bacterium]|jgi:putative ABC transport system permease protein|nr:ABC transporter permease [Tenuifilaceae bacterium]
MKFHKISLAIRFVFKQKGYALINIMGLSLGISACLFITQYVTIQKSYDKQAPFPERTYRVTYQRWTDNGDRVEFASSSPTIGQTLVHQFPEVEAMGRAYKAGGVFSYNDVVLEEELAFWGETPLVDILGFNIILGNPDSCLSVPNQAVISKKTAQRIFGQDDPVGKFLIRNGTENFIITAVFDNVPHNSHFKPEILISLANWEKRDPQMFTSGWFYSGFYTYIRLAVNTNPKDIDRKIEEFIASEFGEVLAEYKTGISFKLQPLLEIHLQSHFMHELEINGDKQSIVMLQIVAWFILIIAWVNFFNLSTISSIKRYKEVGIRKVNGASRYQLLYQLLAESAIINLCALLLAVVMLEIGYSPFANLAGIPVQRDLYGEIWFYQILCVVFLIGTLSAGIYTITGLGGNNLSECLRGTSLGLKGNTVLKKILVTIQFIIAISLLSATTGVFKQYNLIQNTNLGFRLNNMLVVKVPMVGDQSMRNRFSVFVEQSAKLPSVTGTTYSSVVPGKPNIFNRGGIHKQGDDPTDGKNMRLTEIFGNFVEVYQINLIAGKGFTGNPSEDRNNVLLNETAALWLGLQPTEEAIGTLIILEGRPKTLVGILADFNQLSPKESIEPQIFRYPERYQGYFTLQLTDNTSEQTVRDVSKIYSSLFPGNPFDYFFLDQFYGSQYLLDKRFGLVFLIFSLLSVILTIMGLLSLSAYSAQQRRREIGIRKVLGASSWSIIQLLSQSYLLLWLIATTISIPLVWLFLNSWLNDFATRIQLTSAIFLPPLAVVLLMCLVTVSVQSMSAANGNPAESLKRE